MQGGATTVAAGNYYSLVLMRDDSVWAAGKNSRGQLGDGTRIRKGTFTFVRMIPGALAVAAGGYDSMVVKNEIISDER